MNYSPRSRTISAFILLFCGLATAQPAFADTLTGSYSLPPVGDSKLIPFSGGTFDANAITMGLCFPEDLVANVTPYFVFNPFVMLTLDDLATPQFKILCQAATAQEAVFAFVAPLPSGTANVDFNNFPAPGGEFSAEINLVDDPTGLFGAFADALLTIQFDGLVLDPTGDGRARWPIPAGGTTRVRFQLLSRTPVPEPTSLALLVCCLMAVTGVRHLKSRHREAR